MPELVWYQYAFIALTFIWSGFIRSGLGFGGVVFSLPFLLLIVNDALLWLPIISIQLIIMTAFTVIKNQQKSKSFSTKNNKGSIDWPQLRYALKIMIVPKLIGVFGLITLPAELMSGIIFMVVALYSLTYILNKPFSSNSPKLDVLFLILGGYASGTSLVGAPLIIAVLGKKISRHQLRDSLFVLWFALVLIKMSAFIYAGVNLQWIHQLWLLPCVAIGHALGYKLHTKLLAADPSRFYRYLGIILLLLSIAGLARNFL